MQGLRGKHNSNRNKYLNVLYYYEKESISVVYFFTIDNKKCKIYTLIEM